MKKKDWSIPYQEPAVSPELAGMGLAPLLGEEVFNVIKALKAQGMTILLVEQNASAALAIADRGYVLETGSVTLTGPGHELLQNEDVRAAYLGM